MVAEDPYRKGWRTLPIDDISLGDDSNTDDRDISLGDSNVLNEILADDPDLEGYPPELRKIFRTHGAFTEEALRAVCDLDSDDVRVQQCIRHFADFRGAGAYFPRSCEEAASFPHPLVLQIVLEEEEEIDDDDWKSSAEEAALHKNLRTLQFAVYRGCPMTVAVSYYAAENNHLEMLRFVVARGCPMHPSVCNLAARNKSLPMLAFAKNNGCPWGRQTAFDAVRSGDAEIVLYVLRGLPEP